MIYDVEGEECGRFQPLCPSNTSAGSNTIDALWRSRLLPLLFLFGEEIQILILKYSLRGVGIRQQRRFFTEFNKYFTPQCNQTKFLQGGNANGSEL